MAQGQKSDFDILKVATILCGDPVVCQEKTKLSGKLEIPIADTTQRSMQFNVGNMNHHSYFTKDLEKLRSLYTSGSDAYTKLIQSLEQLEFADAAEKVRALSEEESTPELNINTQKPPIFFEVPFLRSGFLGRYIEQNELAKFRTDENNLRKVVVVCSMGGSGKTQLVVRYLTSTDIRKECNISWFSAQDESTLARSLINFASKELLLKADKLDKKSFKELVTAVSNEMTNRDKQWIIVLDNVDDYFPELKEFLNIVSPNDKSFTIVTSKTATILPITHDIGHIALKGLLVEHGKQLVINQLRTEEGAEKLCHAVQGHCLALQQAISYIRQEQVAYQYSISDFLKDLHRSKIEGKACNALDYPLDDDKTTASILSMTLGQTR